MHRFICCSVLTGFFLSAGPVLSNDLPVVSAELATPPLNEYDDAPATPDADDPAIWINPVDRRQSLVIGTAKEAGLVVYDLEGTLVQAILPPNAPTITPQDPPTPGGLNLDAPNPCPESEDGETFGRFNNVDIAYGVRLGSRFRAPKVDVAVVSDRGCDRVRFYRIDPDNPQEPLQDITAGNVPRVYPKRVVQPSPIQPIEEPKPGLQANPLDDQDTAYGLAVWNRRFSHHIFASQRNRSTVRQLKIVPEKGGKLSYRQVRTFLFDPVFKLSAADEDEDEPLTWAPCRDEPDEDPQSEGLVVDHQSHTLYAGFEDIGIYKISLRRPLPKVVSIRGLKKLFEPVKTFGAPFWAIPDDDEFECVYNPQGTPDPEFIVADGRDGFAGDNIEVDLEGLAIYQGKRGRGYLIASSQGDSTFQVFSLRKQNRHLGAFAVDGVEDTDGLDVVNVSLPSHFPSGLLVVHNGAAPEPSSTPPINGFEFDGATQFKFVQWSEVAKAFDPPLQGF